MSERTLAMAVAHHQAGSLDEAERVYREILALPMHPDEADAQHLLGLLLHQRGENDLAIAAIRRAIELNPLADLYRVNLGTLYSASGRFDEAIVQLRKAIELNPATPLAALMTLARSFAAVGRADEAVEALEWIVTRERTGATLVALGEAMLRAGKIKEGFERINEAVALQPGLAEGHAALGLAYEKQGQFDDAMHCYRVALKLNGKLAGAHHNLGYLYHLQGRSIEAAGALREAIAIEPTLFQAHHVLGLSLRAMGQAESAIESFRKSIELKPDFVESWRDVGQLELDRRHFGPAAEAFSHVIELKPTALDYSSLATALSGNDKIDAALLAMEKAIALDPKRADAHFAIGSAYLWCGRHDEAISALNEAKKLDPKHWAAHSRLLYAQLFKGELSPQQLLVEHREWAEVHAKNLIPLLPAMGDRSPDRRLRVGYVSPNFRNQAVMSFIMPILEHRDAWESETFCYSDATVADDWTRRAQAAADEWRDTSHLSFAALAQQIRNDKIDVLVDLTGHIGDGRLQTFALRPAPIQFSYIGYQATTGLDSIDYFFTDEWASPPGESDEQFAEKLWRLPEPFFCYEPPKEAPEVGPLPATANGFITFGCQNNLAKVTPKTLELWANVLKVVSDSRLMLLIPNSEEIRYRITFDLASLGVRRERIEFVYRAAPAEYLARYNQIDIALDPIPFIGHTTTCDAAWMGCPTLTLIGNTFSSRYGSEVMRAVGLYDFVCESEEDFIHQARDCGSDLSRVATLRNALRGQMKASAIVDAKSFTQKLENAYRTAWKNYVKVNS